VFRRLEGIDTIGICHYYQKSWLDTASGNFINEQQADSLLFKWGLSYKK
jgi:hypothetical protein